MVSAASTSNAAVGFIGCIQSLSGGYRRVAARNPANARGDRTVRRCAYPTQSLVLVLCPLPRGEMMRGASRVGEWPRQRAAATHPEFPESGLCLGLDRAAGMGIEDERCNRRAHLEGWQGQISSPTQGAEQMHREETGNDANAALLRARGDPKGSLAGETGDGRPQKSAG